MYIYEWVGRQMATLLGSCTGIGKIWLRATAFFVGSDFLKARTLNTNSAVDGPSHAMHVAYYGTALSWVQALFAWSHANFLSICKIANSYTSAERFPNMTLILANWISIRNTILALSLGPTWTPKVCKIMAFMAIIMGLGLLFYILLGFR